ncbi:MAG: motif-containing protein [Massilia sp.]|nr:motif-containing protein [Massilia sp.]
MRNFLTTVVAGLLLTAAAASASASVVQPGSVSKTYGTGLSTASTGAGSCDTLNATCIRGTDAAGCTRFSDLFDFHSLNYTSIDHLTLTLTFGATNNAFLFFSRRLGGAFCRYDGAWQSFRDRHEPCWQHADDAIIRAQRGTG